MPDITARSSSTLPLLLSSVLLLTGCQALVAYAYDLAADEQRRQCELLASQPERSACIARIDKAEQQAEAARRSR